jgi:hypothetical protein
MVVVSYVYIRKESISILFFGRLGDVSRRRRVRRNTSDAKQKAGSRLEKARGFPWAFARAPRRDDARASDAEDASSRHPR